MSKTIAEVYEEVIASAELQEEYLAAEQEGEEAVVAFAAAHGCETTAAEILAFLQEKLGEEGEFSLDDLDQVAGGATAKKRVRHKPNTTIYVQPGPGEK